MIKIRLKDRINKDIPTELRNKVAQKLLELRKAPNIHWSYSVSPTTRSNGTMTIEMIDAGLKIWNAREKQRNIENALISGFPLHVSIQKTLNTIIRRGYYKKYKHLISDRKEYEI